MTLIDLDIPDVPLVFIQNGDRRQCANRKVIKDSQNIFIKLPSGKLLDVKSMVTILGRLGIHFKAGLSHRALTRLTSKSYPSVPRVFCYKGRMCSTDSYKYETLSVTQPFEHVLRVELNRPEKRNAMNQAFWREMVECFNKISNDSDCRAVVITGAGKIFTAGLDLMDMASSFMQAAPENADVARKALQMQKLILSYQESFSVIEKCTKPVIAAIHSACVGGGVDLITACDIRLCSSDAWFQIKEVEIGLAADVGTLQRLPKIVGNDSLVRELSYTARRLPANEAKEAGLVSHVYPDKESVISAATVMASKIATMSPVAVMGTKHNLNYSRDHSVEEGLKYMATWNMSMLQTEDIMKAVQAGMAKEKATFSKL